MWWAVDMAARLLRLARETGRDLVAADAEVALTACIVSYVLYRATAVTPRLLRVVCRNAE